MTTKKEIVLDYASTDDNDPPDWHAVRASGVAGVIIRRAYGLYDPSHRATSVRTDPTYARDSAAARAAGLKVGGYLMPGFHAGGPAAREQVGVFDVAGGEVVAGTDIPPAIDVEFSGRGIVDTGRSQVEVAEFVGELVDAMRTRYGVDPGIYTSHVQWCDDNGLGGPKDLGARADGSPRQAWLWNKVPYRLKRNSPPDSHPPTQPHYGAAAWDRLDLYRVPPPWDHAGWWFLQYQGDARGWPGFKGIVDVSEFNAATRGIVDGRVAWAQERLNRAGAGHDWALIGVDGDFGAQTERAVRALQHARGVPTTGIIDLATWIALAWS